MTCVKPCLVNHFNMLSPLDRFGYVFLWDSGSSVGNVNGHSKTMNAVDYKPTRPFRICSASEDSDVGFFEGPPFKFHHLNKVSYKINLEKITEIQYSCNTYHFYFTLHLS